VPIHPVTQRRVIRGTAAFLLASVGQRGIAFILLPIFALVLTPEQFGQIGIVVTVAGAVTALLGLGLETAMFRALKLSHGPGTRDAVTRSLGTFGILAPLLAAAALAFPLGIIIERGFDVPAVWVAIGVLAAGLSVATSLCFAVLRAEERLGRYLALGAIQTVMAAALPLLLVVVARAGVAGWFAASAVGGAILLVAGVALSGIRFTRRIDRGIVIAALVFGIPMIPHALSHWGLALSDRIVLGSLVTDAEVGVYHVAYQLGIPIALIASALAQSSQPLYAEASSGESGTRGDLRRLVTYQVLAISLCGVIVALVAPPVIRLLLPSSFGLGVSLVPWIAVGTALYGLYFIPMNVITIYAGRNRWVWPITAGAAGANVLLNVALIPVLGVTAAAINTAIGYGLLLAGVASCARLVAPGGPSYEWRRIAAGVTIICLPLLLLGQRDDPWRELAVRAGVVAVMVGVLFISRLLPRSVLRIAWAATPLPASGRKT
jgi:O-antigen/teichoic acid export membrane protein